MSNDTGPAEKAQGKGYGRTFLVRKALLTTIEATLSRLADQDAKDQIVAWAYDNTAATKVRIQVQVYDSEVAP